MSPLPANESNFPEFINNIFEVENSEADRITFTHGHFVLKKEEEQMSSKNRTVFHSGDLIKQIHNCSHDEDPLCRVIEIMGGGVIKHQHLNKETINTSIFTDFELIKEEVEMTGNIKQPDIIKKERQDEKIICYYDKTKLNKAIIEPILLLANKLKKDIAIIDWTDDRVFKQIRETSKTENKKEELLKIILPNREKGHSRPSSNMIFGKKKIRLSNLTDQFIVFRDDIGFFNEPFHSITYEGNIIAYFQKNKIKILMDGFSNSVSKEISKIFINNVVNSFIFFSELLKDKVGEKTLKEINQYKSFLVTMNQRLKENLRSKINTIQSDIINHYQAIQRQERAIYESNLHLKDIDNKATNMQKELNEEELVNIMLPLIKLKKFDRFYYEPNKIRAITGPIYITNFGNKYYIGEFEIHIYLDGIVKMINLKGQKNTDKDHPHIAKHFPCLGNIKEQIQQMIFKGQFVKLFLLLYEFLCAYSADGAYCQVELYWGNPEKDWCRRCGYPSRGCSCNNREENTEEVIIIGRRNTEENVVSNSSSS